MDLNYSELKIETLSKGEYSVVWYNNINQYPSKQRDYYIKSVCSLKMNPIKCYKVMKNEAKF